MMLCKSVSCSRMIMELLLLLICREQSTQCTAQGKEKSSCLRRDAISQFHALKYRACILFPQTMMAFLCPACCCRTPSCDPMSDRNHEEGYSAGASHTSTWCRCATSSSLLISHPGVLRTSTEKKHHRSASASHSYTTFLCLSTCVLWCALSFLLSCRFCSRSHGESVRLRQISTSCTFLRPTCRSVPGVKEKAVRRAWDPILSCEAGVGSHLDVPSSD